MLGLKGAANVYLVLAFIVPGLPIVWARASSSPAGSTR